MSHENVMAELEKINVREKLSKKDFAELRRMFGARFTAAWKIVKEKRVKKYVFSPSNRVRWIVVGNTTDHLIYEKAPYCHCEDFYHSIMDGKAKACKHLIAQRLACLLNLYTIEEEDDSNYASLFEEWRKT